MSFGATLSPNWNTRSPSDRLQTRLAILHSGGLNPSPLNRELRAFKAAWEAYLTAAFAIGLFDGRHGAELRVRLTGTDDNNFSSAMSECFAAWYLAGRRRLELEPRPSGRGAHCLEFAIKCDGGDINVEVKALRLQLPRLFRSHRLAKGRVNQWLRVRQTDQSDAQKSALGTWQHPSSQDSKYSFACRCYGCTGRGGLFPARSSGGPASFAYKSQ
jgi:hypothetical protein